MKVAPTTPSRQRVDAVQGDRERGVRQAADPDHPEAARVGDRGRQLGSGHPRHAGLLERQAAADELGEARHGAASPSGSSISRPAGWRLIHSLRTSGRE